MKEIHAQKVAPNAPTQPAPALNEVPVIPIQENASSNIVPYKPNLDEVPDFDLLQMLAEFDENPAKLPYLQHKVWLHQQHHQHPCRTKDQPL